MIKKKKIDLKPVSIDAHFKYLCPNTDCMSIHWLTSKECQTKNFIVVCDCGESFKPKQIKKLKIVYKTRRKTDEPIQQQSATNTSQEVPVDIMTKCVTILVGYGFTEKESSDLVKNTYSYKPTDSCSVLIKNILGSIGVNESNVKE